MDKRVEFYKIDYSFLPLASCNKTDEELKQQFTNAVKNKTGAEKGDLISLNPSNDTSVTIEILEVKDDFIFGIIGRLEDLKDGILRRFRHKKDMTIVSDADTEVVNYCVENYTYFYIRLEDLLCAVLSNNSAPKFRRHFRNYLSGVMQTLCLLDDINIVIVLDDKIDYKLNRVANINEIKIVFDDSSAVGNNMLNLFDTFRISQSSLLEAKVDLNLKAATITENTRNELKRFNSFRSDFRKLEIVGTDAEEEEIQMELVERILTKKVSIDIDERYLKSTNDLEKIKEALLEALPAI